MWVNFGSGNRIFLMAPNHYLNQCWLIISEVLWHCEPEGNFRGSAQDILSMDRWMDGYEFENCKPYLGLSTLYGLHHISDLESVIHKILWDPASSLNAYLKYKDSILDFCMWSLVTDGSVSKSTPLRSFSCDALLLVWDSLQLLCFS